LLKGLLSSAAIVFLIVSFLVILGNAASLWFSPPGKRETRI
jgi:hypothetical protein